MKINTQVLLNGYPQRSGVVKSKPFKKWFREYVVVELNEVNRTIDYPVSLIREI